MTYDTSDAKKLFSDPFADEATVSLPEDTQRVMRAVTRECNELGRRLTPSGERVYSDKALEDSAVFVIEHGSGIRPVELCSARLRASLRAPRVERVIDLNGKKRTIRVVAAKTESVTRKVR
jgi:hypothetical protein